MDDLETQMDYLLRFVAPIAPEEQGLRGVRLLRVGDKSVGITWEGGPLVCASSLGECVRIAAEGNGWHRVA